jgi:hypothetical protein
MRHATHAQRRRSIPWMVAVTLISTPVSAQSINPAVTQDNIDATICVRGWTSTVRPSFWESQKIKDEMLKARGETWLAAPLYELDHIVPLCLGGAPRDRSNLQLEPWDEAHRKDRVEVVASQCVCNRQVSLKEAQADLAGDWRVAYAKYARMVCRRQR